METPVLVHANTPMNVTPKNNILPMILALILVIGAGIGTGYLLSRQKPASTTDTKSASMVKSETEAGTMDTKTFKDYATGTLEAGGINGEGTHKLVRPGGVSQTVYLISSLVDLEPFVGKKVEVYGQTIRAKTAGWLMDVGRIKVVE
jgi:hypothetical protein